MSNELLNAHIAYGEPCGEDADFAQIADWAGYLLLENRPEDKPDGYVVCATWPDDKKGEMTLKTFISESSLSEARQRIKTLEYKENLKPRIAEIRFIKDK